LNGGRGQQIADDRKNGRKSLRANHQWTLAPFAGKTARYHYSFDPPKWEVQLQLSCAFSQSFLGSLTTSASVLFDLSFKTPVRDGLPA
jgi:hypothetical protein